MVFFRFLFFFVSFYSYCELHAQLSQETLYVTWTNDPTSSMTIQWLTTIEEKDTFITYAQKSQSPQWIAQEGRLFALPFSSNYLVHTLNLIHLLPDTEYVFKLKNNETVYQFKTAPLTLERPVHFVVGGDMYHDGIDLMKQTCREAAKTSPVFALIGGDIAYAVPSSHKPVQLIERWIDWLKAWHETMITPEKNLIPVIAAIGNHDLLGGYNQKPKQAAIFSALFPMPGARIYNLLNFSSYLSLYILDSGHANRVGGLQADWLRKTLQRSQIATHQFAIYHVPAYPSIRDYKNKTSLSIRRYWVPLFEKFGIQAVFEHHDHAYKRTYPLLKNKKNSSGVIYIGDGAWGIENTRVPPTKKNRFYLTKFISQRHFIDVTLTPTRQNFRCISDTGQLLDEFTREIK